MTIGEIARQTVITAAPHASVESIVESMDEHDVGCIVIEQDAEPIGLVTDRKLAMQLADTPDLASHAVKEYMTTELITMHESAGIAETLETLSEAGIRRVPIVDDDQELIGIVSMDDLVVLLADEMELLARVAAQQSPRF